ncbi:FkbM family methyltransferase [Chitinophaga japonensis]|uniref:FkbM family methyltransferase n=1 Tax=Chitinophaga japonensis TaxID=104662 RepID=A0A562STD9_CHIJA|nr:FkbM family methyltransferase [Chitinophaga japonensis]TWI84559.1 FkbM family methyltransferase [Chitinophaga japonensis]
MKKILRNVFLSLFSFLKIKVDGKPLVYWLGRAYLPADDKLDLLSVESSVRYDLMKRWGPRSAQFITLLKSLSINENLYIVFFRNFMKHIGLFESQLGQDCFVDTLLHNKRNGVFVEIGVGDGKRLSNTFFFEKHRDWNGVLCEPSKCFHQAISTNRNAVLIPQAVFKVSGAKLDFVEVKGEEELSTIRQYIAIDRHSREHYIEYPVSTISFNDLCAEYVPAGKIDYVSIDTEGSEYEIISAIDFNRVDISIISIEHNYNLEKLSRIRSVLLKHSYIEIDNEVFSWDVFFVKKAILEPFLN